VKRVLLNKVFAEGFVAPSDYQVIGKKGQPQGTVKVGLKFTPKVKLKKTCRRVNVLIWFR
jgi:hypothetical protein